MLLSSLVIIVCHGLLPDIHKEAGFLQQTPKKKVKSFLQHFKKPQGR
jgi:hypothetical protein